MLIDTFERRIKELIEKIPHSKTYSWYINKDTEERTGCWVTVTIPNSIDITLYNDSLDSAMQKVLKMLKIEAQSYENETVNENTEEEND